MKNVNGNKQISLGKAVFSGWVSLLVLATACVIFWRPSEVGRLGLLIFWGLVLSLFYIANCLLITVPLRTLFARKFGTISRFTRSLIGGFLFAMTVPFWSLLLRHLDLHDMLLHICLAFISGGIGLYFAAEAEP